jgi:alpha-L-rhamnosidase
MLQLKLYRKLSASLSLLAMSLMSDFSHGQLPPVFDTSQNHVRISEMARAYITPSRMVWTSDDNSGKQVINPEYLLKPASGQAVLAGSDHFIMKNTGEGNAAVLLDFGIQLHGGLQIVTTRKNKESQRRVRIRFGESVAEAMSNVDESTATNDHAMRDFEVVLPWLGSIETGNSGFRFAHIELLGHDEELEIKEISAVFVYRDIPYLGYFESSNPNLDMIWLTGAYTVHLNMQEYIWDGIKRDRLVWVGDLHPEIMTIIAAFGYNDIVPKSLDLIRDATPLPGWMNGISSYTLWWIIIHHDWYLYTGDRQYLSEQHEYLAELLHLLTTKIDESGKEQLDGMRFLDWPSSTNTEATHAGLQSLMLMAFEAGKAMAEVLDDTATAKLCIEAIKNMRRYSPDPAGSKQAAALLALAKLIDQDEAETIITQDGVKNFSTFYGYYMLNALAKAGNHSKAIDFIEEYWGAMLQLGGTTFWEHFDISWMENAGRIDELTPNDKIDVHGAYGDHCYVGYRHSLCHGWAGNPTAWLTQFVLGVNIIEPGCKTIMLSPNLGNLQWVKGAYPTPFGLLEIQHKKDDQGKIVTTYQAPVGLDVIVNNPN